MGMPRPQMGMPMPMPMMGMGMGPGMMPNFPPPLPPGWSEHTGKSHPRSSWWLH